MFSLLIIFVLTLEPDYHVLVSQCVEGFKSKEHCQQFAAMAVNKIGADRVVMATCKERKEA